MAKTILVTGGAGFVGSHLAEKLLQDGYRVIIVDDLSNGTFTNLKGIRSDIRFLQSDISRPLRELTVFLSEFAFDGIFHLACFPRSISLKDPYRDLEVNARGTLNVLELARLHNSKVVFTSNSGIYGDPEYLPIDEKHPDKPSTPYDANKLVSEYYMKIYHHIYGLPIGICRLATVYGERQRTKPDWKPVIPEFATNILKDQPSTIYWDGEQTRDLIYVQDVVQGLIKAFKSEKTGDQTFILGTNIETSINQIYSIICNAFDAQPQIVRSNKIAGDIRRMKLSYAKAASTFGFNPEYNLKEGISNYIAWLMTQ